MKYTKNAVTTQQWSFLKNTWHPTRNNILLEETTIGVHMKFWWQCHNGHEWQARINSVIIGFPSNTNGCPYCRGLKVNQSNCLATTHPELAKQWHSQNVISPTQVTAGSNKKALWKCELGHEWTAIIASRKRGNKCPYCSKRLVDKSNCLSTTHPDIAKQWHPTKNNVITPESIAAGSGIFVWWQCPVAVDHEWKATPNKRTSGRNCPCCSGQKIVESNCLATLYPEISAQWHPTKNGNVTPHKISSGSQKKYWWLCPTSTSHEWQSTVANRTKLKNGCPFCNQSKGELTISAILNKMHIQFEQEKTFSTCRDKSLLFFDFYIKDNIGYKLIEYQGRQHYDKIGTGFGSHNPTAVYNGIKRRDKIKRAWCKKHNVPLLEIPYWKLPVIENILIDFIDLP